MKKEREQVNGYGTASFFMQKWPDDQFLDQIGLTVYKEEEEQEKVEGLGEILKKLGRNVAKMLKSVEGEGRDEGLIRGFGWGNMMR